MSHLSGQHSLLNTKCMSLPSYPWLWVQITKYLNINSSEPGPWCTGCHKKLSISKKGKQLTNGHFFGTPGRQSKKKTIKSNSLLGRLFLCLNLKRLLGCGPQHLILAELSRLLCLFLRFWFWSKVQCYILFNQPWLMTIIVSELADNLLDINKIDNDTKTFFHVGWQSNCSGPHNRGLHLVHWQ